jgi:tRNA A-37 threonylcarbamoyl transferase component Bud32
MDHDFDAEKSEAFIAAALSRGLLTDPQAETLRRESSQRLLMPSRLAIESGILDPTEAEIAEAFAAPSDLAPGYELLDVLGYGALGVVYRARQIRLKRDVAVKSIMPSRLVEKNVLARFQQEGAAIGRLQHPNIVSAYDFGSHKHRFYLVMEFVRGTDLRMRLDEGGRIDVPTALWLVRQVASGLAHALANGIIHRDVKPGNLILTEAPAGFDLPPGIPLVKIADFGLARLMSQADAEEDTRLTIAGSALGTPMFSAPEQLSGDAVDHRADIYALGATLLNTLTGKPPFQEKKISKLITAKLTGKKYDIQSLPDGVPDAVVDLIDRMMAHDPNDRIDQYEKLIDKIDDIQNVVASRVGQQSRRRRLAVFIGTATLLATVFAVASVLLPRYLAGPEPTQQRTSRETALFDGENVEPWRASRGLWRIGQDDDGGRVLIGRGAASRSIPAPELGGSAVSTFAFRVGIDLVGAEAAEVHFGFDGDDIDRSARWVVRYGADGLVMGRSKGIDAELDIMQERTMPPRARGDEGPGYHHLVVEYHGDYWFAFLDDEPTPFGSSTANPQANNHTIQLLAIGDDVHFSDIASIVMRAKSPQEGQ